MSGLLKLYLLFVIFISLNRSEEVASKNQAKTHQKNRCPYKLRRLWQNDISSFPFAAPPLVADIDGDGGLDIVAAPFGEALTVIEGESGKHLHDTSWPQHNLDRSIHSTPIQFDVDGDGLMDILFVTTQAEGLFYTGKGHALKQYHFQLPPAYVKPNWYTDVSSVDHSDIDQYVSSKFTKSHQFPVDAHVLSTPALHAMRYLVVPVSFFFSEDDHNESSATGSWGKTDRDKYFVTAIMTLDLMKLFLVKKTGEGNEQDPESYTTTTFLELTQNASHLLFSPTVVDVSDSYTSPDVIIGTSKGNLYRISLEGKHRTGFPLALGPLSGQISAGNVNTDASLELIAIESTGKVHCLDSVTGNTLWTSQVGGNVFAGSRLVDIDDDGVLDVVFANDLGEVYALQGSSGEILTNYPFKAGKRISGNILVTKFNILTAPVDLMFVSDDGMLHILASDHSCHWTMSLGEASLVDILSHDLVLMGRGVEFLLATSDGSLACFGSGTETPVDELGPMQFRMNYRRLSSPLQGSDFTFVRHKTVALIEDRTRRLKEVTGSSFFLYVSVFTELKEKFILNVYLGSDVVGQQAVIGAVDSIEVKVQTPEQPGQAQLTIVLVDKHGFTSTDSMFLKFNQLILQDLQWLVLAPFIGMLVILLVNHGFPAKDLLPVTFPSKSK